MLKETNIKHLLIWLSSDPVAESLICLDGFPQKVDRLLIAPVRNKSPEPDEKEEMDEGFMGRWKSFFSTNPKEPDPKEELEKKQHSYLDENVWDLLREELKECPDDQLELTLICGHKEGVHAMRDFFQLLAQPERKQDKDLLIKSMKRISLMVLEKSPAKGKSLKKVDWDGLVEKLNKRSAGMPQLKWYLKHPVESLPDMVNLHLLGCILKMVEQPLIDKVNPGPEFPFGELLK